MYFKDKCHARRGFLHITCLELGCPPRLRSKKSSCWRVSGDRTTWHRGHRSSRSISCIGRRQFQADLFARRATAHPLRFLFALGNCAFGVGGGRNPNMTTSGAIAVFCATFVPAAICTFAMRRMGSSGPSSSASSAFCFSASSSAVSAALYCDQSCACAMPCKILS